MKNQVITHVLQHKVAYAILAFLLAVVGITFMQTPNFNSTGEFSGNVGSLATSKVVVSSPNNNFRVEQGGQVTVTLKTDSKSPSSIYAVNQTNPKARPIVLAANVTTPAYAVTVSNKLKIGEAYKFGVLSGKDKALSSSIFTVTQAESAKKGFSLSSSKVSTGQNVTLKNMNLGESFSAYATHVDTGAEVRLANNVSGSEVKVTFPSTAATGAYNVYVVTQSGLRVESGVTMNVTANLNQEAKGGMNTGFVSNSTQTSTGTAALESNVTNNGVTFTSPTSSVTVTAGSPVTVSFKATSVDEKFSLYATNVTGEETLVAKTALPGESVTWVPTVTGTYNLVVVGEESQLVSKFTVTVKESVANTTTSSAGVTSGVTNTAPVTSTVTSGVTNTAPVTGTVTSGVTNTSSGVSNNPNPKPIDLNPPCEDSDSPLGCLPPPPEPEPSN